MDDFPPSLLEDLRARRCVLFVGAGVSISAGLPNWELFLRRIAACSGVNWLWDGIPSDEAQFQLVEAVGRDRVVSLMMSVLTPECPPSTSFQRFCKLMGLANFAAIVSTNWDMILDESGCCSQVAHIGRDDDLIDEFLFKESTLPTFHSSSFTRQKPLLIKLQGDISNPSTLSLSRDDYSRTFSAKSRFLDRLTRRYSILSMGRSNHQFGDDFASYSPDAVIPRMREIFVCNDLSHEDKQKLAERGIIGLTYSSRETNWEGNRLYLENLVALLNGDRQS
jgi:hypothetical protein